MARREAQATIETLDEFAEGGLGVEMRTLIVSNEGFRDISPGAPSYMTQMELGNFLPEDHRQSTLHNRKKYITDHDRLLMYMRGGISKVIVDDPAYDTWLNGVSFEDQKLTEVVSKIWPVIEEPLEVADIWAGVFGMGFVILGYNDSQDLAAPVDKADNITWAEGFSRTHIDEILFGNDPNDTSTYRQPRAALIRAGKPGEEGSEQILVHADRILFVTRNKHVHPINGGSDLDKPYNDLEDGLGVSWASAESYYAGASPKMLLKTMKPLTTKQDSAIEEQTRQMQSNLRHLIKMLHGMDFTKLTSGADVAKPLEHVVAVFTFLSTSTGIPFSKWFRHHLNGGEAIDWANREWDEYIGNRRRRFGKRIIHRLLGKLAKAKMITDAQAQAIPIWSPPRIMTREDIARIARNEATSIATAAKGAGMIHKELADRFQPLTPEQIAMIKALGPSAEGDDEDEQQTETKTGRRQALKKE